MKFLNAFLICFLLTGCAAMQKDFEDHVCNSEGAFQKGYNEGNSGEQMNNYWVDQCPPESQVLVRREYQRGYVEAQANRPTQVNIINENIRENRGQGFGSGGPGWMCKEAYGKKECGYDCKEAFGNIRCARYPGNNCVESYGKIKCGRECKAEFGDIKCERYE